MYIPIHYIISINKLIDNKSLNLSLLIICLYSIIITLLLKMYRVNITDGKTILIFSAIKYNFYLRRN